MSILSNTSSNAKRIWLVDLNPLRLEEPPTWWQTMLYDYDKMLRVMPSQKEHAYRLCRVVRAEARLGLQALVVHEHPDTRSCIKFGVVPVATLVPGAIHSNKVIRDLMARDTWRLHRGDPNKIVDALEQQEADEQAAQQRESEAEFDELAANAYRAIRYGRPEQIDLGAKPYNPFEGLHIGLLPELPELPDDVVGGFGGDREPITELDLQNRDRVSSPTPPEGTAGQPSSIILTDS